MDTILFGLFYCPDEPHLVKQELHGDAAPIYTNSTQGFFFNHHHPGT
jgi:hypothetical protein